MRTSLRSGLHVALNSPRVFGLAAIALLLEVIVRFVLAVTVHPVLAVIWPPVVALPLLGAGAPAVQNRLKGSDETPELELGSMLREIGLGLLVIAVVGHLVALVVGASAFLFVDTAVRFVEYALGGTIPFGVVLFVPLSGVAAGTLIAWGLLAPAVERLVAGESLSTAAVAPLRVFSDRRRSVGILSVHVGAVSVAAVVFAVFLSLIRGRNVIRPTIGTKEAAVFALVTIFGVVAAVLVVVGIFGYPIHVALAAGSPDRPSAVPVGRIAVAGLLISGLVVGTGVVRVTETRPMPADTAATPLPADGTDAYARAVERTSAGDHRVILENIENDDMYTITVVRSSRQMLFSIQRDRQRDEPLRAGYGDSSVRYPANHYLETYSLGERRIEGLDSRSRVANTVPGYWEISSDYQITGGVGLPASTTGNWEVIREANGTQTLELTDDAAVFDAVLSGDSENVSAETAWVRMRVDRERGVVRGGRARLNGTISGDQRIDRNYSYTVETGSDLDFDRPDGLGSRSVGEWTWDLFAY